MLPERATAASEIPKDHELPKVYPMGHGCTWKRSGDGEKT